MENKESEKCYKEKLIKSLKKEVKQIMEEAVTKKYIHEDSATITSLCAAVELCVSHGLKRRALGLFKSSSTTALLHKVAKSFQPAATIVQLVAEVENCDPNKRSSSGSESASKLSVSSQKPPLQKKNSIATTKYLWIRLALIEKLLARIVDYIVCNCSKYYEKDALVADPDYGSILSSLLVGPCALDFSKLRTGEHLWADPHADELVQRHRISSSQFPSPASPPATKRPGLSYKGSIGFSNSDDSMRSKDYVESLHQNSKSTLLYGKNNVIVFMAGNEALAGYLSLHQCGVTLILKWTPNQLMNGCSDSIAQDKSVYWNHALNVALEEIVYVHCHQGRESDWIVLVGQDGVQRPPIHFPRGGHLLAFLSCLENGLLPNAMLDPPLWSQRGKGKVFPKLRRKGSSRFHNSPKKEDTIQENGDGDLNDSNSASDFVFRIVFPNFEKTFPQIEDILDKSVWESRPSSPKVMPSTPRSTPIHSVSTTSSTSSSKSLDQQMSVQETGEPIQTVCLTMKRQIISRAFYGWLAHCRHLRTVRTHLIGLVRNSIVKADTPVDASEGLTKEIWQRWKEENSIDMQELYRLVYFGGIQHALRKELWPIMLSGKVEGENSENLRKEYEDHMSQWLAVEAIVRQKDKEIMAANLAKLSSEGGMTGVSCTAGTSGAFLQANDSNEVFEEMSSFESSCSEGTKLEVSAVDQDTTFSSSEEKATKGSSSDSGQKEEDATKDKSSAEAVEERGTRQKSFIQGESTNIVVMEDQSSDDSCSTDGSPHSNGGGVYSNEILEQFGLNLHRIDKDVKRCDRNHWYFTESNLEKLRNVMCTYVWENMEMGYVQGMCDLAAPLLVILDDEVQAYGCFRNLMSRMSANFPSGGSAMDAHFANMRSLLQVLDNDLFTLIRQNGDYTHFYFSYRWFLLDFKREFCYEDVFLVWETIWASRHVASNDFVLFLALALLTYYRDIILSNSMDFTDIIKFFNEMAERHDAKSVLQIARNLVLQLQTLIENK